MPDPFPTAPCDTRHPPGDRGPGPAAPWPRWRSSTPTEIPCAANRPDGSGAEILHAYRNPIRAWDLGNGFTMLIGANQALIILEIGYIQGSTADVIVHAMRAREKFLR